jgi:hypothetical protein
LPLHDAMSQSADTHAVEATLPVHTALQLLLHPPQWEALVTMLISHPSALAPLQLPKPALQLAT